MPIDLPGVLLDTLPPVYTTGAEKLWFGDPEEPPFFGFSLGGDGLWSEWSLGERANNLTWDGAIRGISEVEKSLIFSRSHILRQKLRPDGDILIPFYLADRRYLLPVDQGGPHVPGYILGSLDYDTHGHVLSAHRGGELFSVGGHTLPATLHSAGISCEQLYEELASPEGGEIFMINPHSPDRP